MTPMSDEYWRRRREGWPELSSFHAEVNRRFWEGTDYPYGRRIDPDLPEDRPYIPLWNQYRDEVMEQQLNADTAAANDEADLLAGTHSLTPAESDQAREALAPPRNVDPGTGAPLPFQSEVGGQTYEERIKLFLNSWVDETHAAFVDGQGPAEHADEDNLHSFDRIAEICNAGKDEVDTLFGDYNTGPPFEAGVNLFDQWEEENDDLAGMDDDQKLAKARDLVEYVLQSNEGVTAINGEHNAIPNRTDIAPGETEAEATILTRIKDDIAAAHRDRLNEIDRGWPATANEGTIFMQRFKADTDLGNRRMFWDTFQTAIHEYIHTLAHDDYEDYANTFGDESEEYNTLIEGTDSFLTEIVWTNITPKVQSAGLREKVEGPTYAAQPFDSRTVPSIEGQRYASYAQTERVVELVGIHNLYAAYFLGRADLVGASSP